MSQEAEERCGGLSAVSNTMLCALGLILAQGDQGVR